MMELLRHSSEKLDLTLQAFTRFERDKGYFSDMQDVRVIPTFNSLQETFERLVGLQKKLSRLEQYCDKTERIVGLRNMK